MLRVSRIYFPWILILVPSIAAAEPQGAVCRVNNHLAQLKNVGSGTLVDKTDDGREGLDYEQEQKNLAMHGA
jgi:hypothetical protein